MRASSLAIAGGALAILLWLAAPGALFGLAKAALELQQVPAAIAGIALIVLLAGPRGLPRVAGWMVLGGVGGVALRVATGTLGVNGWIPGEAVSPAESLIEAAWLVVFAVMAWRSAPPRVMGPALMLAVATTRLGGYAQAFVPFLWEETLGEAARLGAGILAGLVAGLLLTLLAGWALAILARVPARWVAPGRVLAALATAAAIRHMVSG